MRILVTYASRMGSTAEIGRFIAQQLSGAGHDVDVSPCTSAPDASRYQAVILGSGLYVGRWDKAALRYLRAQSAQLAQRPTWLFQSGPCGEGFDLADVETPGAVRRLSAPIGLAPPVTFGGRLDRTRARTRVSRWLATGRYAGDFRDWDQVRAWTAGVEAQLADGRHGAPLPAF